MRNLIKLPFVGLIYIYRYCISPILPKTCRFTPSCSEYAIEAYKTHAIHIATYLTFKRILRCHPWGEYCFDPVPNKKR